MRTVESEVWPAWAWEWALPGPGLADGADQPPPLGQGHDGHGDGDEDGNWDGGAALEDLFPAWLPPEAVGPPE